MNRPVGPLSPAVSYAHHPQRPGRSLHGFTLIELLVVISVVAVLVALLAPALATAKRAAAQAGCGAHLRQLGLAVQMHVDARDGTYPVARYMPEPVLTVDPDPDPPLPSVLAGQIDGGADSGAWRCPGDKQMAALTGTSYSYASGMSGLRLEQTFFAQALGWPATRIPVMQDFDADTVLLSGGDEITVGPFHQRRNFLFADGHVKGL